MAITTKAGLLGNLRNLKWFADCDCDEVLPRGYDLSVDVEVQARTDALPAMNTDSEVLPTCFVCSDVNQPP